MSADRTFVTELATGLGMVGWPDPDERAALAATMAARPTTMANLTDLDWRRLDELFASGDLAADFEQGFANGRAFLRAADALNGRPPRIVEWTGPRRAPGDEVVPADLRVDHVYLVSCKYLSRVLHNSSPQRLVDGLLTHAPVGERGNWYQVVAPAEHQALYVAAAEALGGAWPAGVSGLDADQRRRLAVGLRGAWPDGAVEAYGRLTTAVSEATAARWSSAITPRNREALLWRLLRIGSAPYFVLGSSPAGPMRLRIDTPWDWRQRYALRRFEVTAPAGGQPRVSWRGAYGVAATGEERSVEGHVELRWSHGRFGGPPEAKVYLDTPHDEVPGYHPLDPAGDSLAGVDDATGPGVPEAFTGSDGTESTAGVDGTESCTGVDGDDRMASGAPPPAGSEALRLFGFPTDH